MRVLRAAHQRILKKFVGDTRVWYIPHDQLVKITGDPSTKGAYLSTSNKSIAKGHHGVVLISAGMHDAGTAEQAAHTIEHELTHAATDFAIRNNYRGTKTIVEKMHKDFVQQLRAAGIDPSTVYGTKDIYEFVAEAFSNKRLSRRCWSSIASRRTWPRRSVSPPTVGRRGGRRSPPWCATRSGWTLPDAAAR